MPDGSVPPRLATPPFEPPPAPPKAKQPPEPPPKPIRYVPTCWLSDGMLAYIRWNREQGTLLRVRVVCASGNHGRVVNEQYNVNSWKHIDDILVPEGTPQGSIPNMLEICRILDGG